MVKLERQGMLGTTATIVQTDGSWEAKAEELNWLPVGGMTTVVSQKATKPGSSVVERER